MIRTITEHRATDAVVSTQLVCDGCGANTPFTQTSGTLATLATAFAELRAAHGFVEVWPDPWPEGTTAPAKIGEAYVKDLCARCAPAGAP